jgi:cysteine dioxygenase
MGGADELWKVLSSWDHACVPPTRRTIRRVLGELCLRREALADWIAFGAIAYQRNLIHRSSRFEALLLCWRSGQRSPIHDHAGSTCGVRVIAGTATETIYATSPCGSLYPERSRRLEAGSVSVAHDADVHQMGNLAPAGNDLITLHIYSPPLSAMRVYSLSETTLADHDRLAALRPKERARAIGGNKAHVGSSSTPKRVSKVTQ